MTTGWQATFNHLSSTCLESAAFESKIQILEHFCLFFDCFFFVSHSLTLSFYIACKPERSAGLCRPLVSREAVFFSLLSSLW